MVRLKKSVKVLIIAICLLVVSVGTVLAVVLTRKPDSSNLKTPQMGFTSQQDLFASAVVNSKTNYLPVLLNGSPYETVTTYDKVVEFGKNYFIESLTVGEKENSNLYIFKEDQTKSNGFDVKNLCDTTNNGGFVEPDADSFTVHSVVGNFAVIESEFAEDEHFSNSVYRLVCFANFNKPVEVFEFDAKLGKQLIVDSFDVILTKNYFLLAYYENYDHATFTGNYNIISFKLTSNPIDETSANFNHIKTYEKTQGDYLRVVDDQNFFVVESVNFFDIYYYSNRELKSIKNQIQKNQDGFDLNAFDVIYLNNNLYLLETVSYFYGDAPLNENSVYYDINALSQNVYINYSYKILKFNNGALETFDYELAEGYAKLKTSSAKYAIEGYYSLFQQKIEDNNLIEDYLSSYYSSSNNELIVQYESTTIEPIIYAGKNKFVTEKRIFSVKNDTLSNIIVFGSEDFAYSLQSTQNFTGSVIVISNGTNSGLCTLDGTILFSPDKSSYTSIMQISSNEFVGEVANRFNKISKDGKLIAEISVNTDEKNNSYMFNKNIDFLFDVDNGVSTIKQYTNGIVATNVDSYSFLSLSNGAVLRFVDKETSKVLHLQIVDQYGKLSSQHYSFIEPAEQSGGGTEPLNLSANEEEISVEPYEYKLLKKIEHSYNGETYYYQLWGSATTNHGHFSLIDVYYSAYDTNQGSQLVATLTMPKETNPTFSVTVQKGYRLETLKCCLEFSNPFQFTYKQTNVAKGENYITNLTTMFDVSCKKSGETDAVFYDGKTFKGSYNTNINVLIYSQQHEFEVSKSGDSGMIGMHPASLEWDFHIVPLTFDFWFYEAPTVTVTEPQQIISKPGSSNSIVKPEVTYESRVVFEGIENGYQKDFPDIFTYEYLDNPTINITVDVNKLTDSEYLINVPKGNDIIGAKITRWVADVLWASPGEYTTIRSGTGGDGNWRSTIHTTDNYMNVADETVDFDSDWLANNQYGIIYFYAFYTGNQYTVEFYDSFNNEDGSTTKVEGVIQTTKLYSDGVEVSPIQANFGYYFDTEAPVKSGYVFKGWNISNSKSFYYGAPAYKRATFDCTDSTATSVSLTSWNITSFDMSTYSHGDKYLDFKSLNPDQGAVVKFIALWEPLPVTINFQIGVRLQGNSFYSGLRDGQENSVVMAQITQGLTAPDMNVKSSSSLIFEDYETADHVVYIQYETGPITVKGSTAYKISDLVDYDSDYDWKWKDLLLRENVNAMYTMGLLFDCWMIRTLTAGDDVYADASTMNEKLSDYLGKGGTSITFYAKYTPKNFDVFYNTDTTLAYGSTLANEVVFNINKQEAGNRVPEYTCVDKKGDPLELIPLDVTTGWVGGRSFVEDNVTITAKMSSETGTIPNIFHKIVLSNFGIETKSGAYYLATITINYNENATNNDSKFTVTAVYQGTSTTLQVQVIKIKDANYYVVTDHIITKSYATTNDLSKDYYQYFTLQLTDPTQNDLTNKLEQSFIISVFNLKFTSQKNADGSCTFSSSTILDYSTHGFDMMVHTITNHTTADMISSAGNGNYLSLAVTPLTKDSAGHYFMTRTDQSFQSQRVYFDYNGPGIYRFSAGYSDLGTLFISQTDDLIEEYWYEYIVTTNLPAKDGLHNFVYLDITNNNEVLAYYIPYCDASTQEFSVASINNTQITVFAPNQDYVYNSARPNHSSGTVKLETKSYLSELVIEGKTIKLSFENEFDVGAFKYKGFYITSSGAVTFISLTDKPTINIYGKTFKAFWGVSFEIEDSGKNVRSYMLYAALDSNNMLVYLLYTNVGYDSDSVSYSRTGIQATFSDLSSFITAKINKEFGDNYGNDTIDAGATIEVYNKSYGGVAIPDADTNHDDLISKYPIIPTQTRVIKISPTDGYLLQTISIVFDSLKFYQGDNSSFDKGDVTATIFHFDLINLLLERQGGADKKGFYYGLQYAKENVASETTLGMKYSGEIFKPLNNYTQSGSNNRLGLYVTYSYDIPWLVSKPSDFCLESIYILVGGMYSNVNIDIKTISYTEIDFELSKENATNMLGLSTDSAYQRYESSSLGMALCKDDNGLVGSTAINYSLSALTKLSMVAKIDGSYILLGSGSYDASYVVVKPNHIRVIFLGKANYFKEEFKIFSSGPDYSNYFTQGKFYCMNEGSNSDADSGGSQLSAFEALSGFPNIEGRKPDKSSLTNPLRSTDYLTMITIMDGSNYFLNSIAGPDNDLICYKKFTLALTVNYNAVESVINSYLYNGVLTNTPDKPVSGYQNVTSFVDGLNSHTYYEDSANKTAWKLVGNNYYGYQLDNKTKKNSWFNDTVLTNIDYIYNSAQIDGSGKYNPYLISDGNWQKIANEEQTPMKVFGYALTYTYYDIPGYYLQYINIKTVDYGMLTLAIGPSLLSGMDTQIVSSGRLYGKENLYYELTYFADETIGKYVLKLYRELDVDNNRFANIESLGILSNDFEISFYSMAYIVNISYVDNVNHDGNPISSTDSLVWKDSSGIATKKNQSLYYDTFTMISYYLEMDGYTFIGWGSEKYYDGTNLANRYSYDANTGLSSWNTMSTWASIISYFNYSKRFELVSSLCYDQDALYSYDFYVKSSDSNESSQRKNSSGYFITDTGNSSTENYNFWLAYARLFASSIGFTHTSDFITKGYNITLYGVWRANTYALEFNTYDAASEGNGTTSAAIQKNNYATLSYTWAKNKPNGFYLEGNSTTYYCYVTFDSNDWYIVDSNDVKEKRGSSIYSYKPDTSTPFIFGAENKLDFVIDRYGYSWLGWFTQRYGSNLKQGTDIQELYVSSCMVFGSDFYYRQFTANDSSTRRLPTLNHELYLTFETKTENYSEFVYAGEACVEKEYIDPTNPLNRELYVCHYDYNSNKGGSLMKINGVDYYISLDYTYSDKQGKNARITKRADTTTYVAIGAYFDTSIAYNNYMVEEDAESNPYVSVTREKYNANQEATLWGKKLVLHAYWQMNKYTYVVDVCDNNVNVSTHSVGSSPVENLPMTGSNVVFGDAFFDDNIDSAGINYEDEVHFRLSNFIPKRVGYDFLGWTYGFKYTNLADPNYQDYSHQMISGNYTLNQGLITYYQANLGVVLYSSGNFNEVVIDGAHNTLESKEDIFVSEVYGDIDNGGLHYVYVYALWREQTYTINLSLNIGNQGLLNAYDTDSKYAVGFYNRLEDVPVYEEFIGVNNKYLHQENSYTEVPANLLFELKFDRKVEDAILRVRFKDGAGFIEKSYKLSDLFAVSAGYYLLGWMLEAGSTYVDTQHPDIDSNLMFITNTLLTTFAKDGKLLNMNAEGTSVFSEGNELVFDLNFYNRLKNSDYKQCSDGSNVPFVESNIDSLNVLDGPGASSNFGSIKINSETYYLETDPIDFRLYFRYRGVKYYAKLYYTTITPSGTIYTYLRNDDSFLYFTKGESEYVIRYEKFGDGSYKAYYIDNDYKNINYVDIKIAVFAQKEHDDIINQNLFSLNLDSYSFKYDESSYVIASFANKTTRQFTLYALWKYKEDLTTNIINGNNAQEDSTSASNGGLAGYYVINDTEKSSGQYEDKTTRIFKFYEDIDFDIIPYFNGRYISEIKFDFWRLEQTTADTANFMFANFVNVKYTVTFKFSWDSANKRVVINKINVTSYNAGSVNQDYEVNFDADLNLGVTSAELKSYFKILDKAELVDSAVSNQDIRYNILKETEYGSQYDRIDINMLSFDFDKVMTNIDVTCKFSVQTFSLEFYGVLDDNGNTMKPVAGSSNLFTVSFNNEEFAKNVESVSSMYPEQYAYKSYEPKAYDSKNIATIQQDCATSVSTYNVPYGYFIYGVAYPSALPPNRSIDAVIDQMLAENSYYGFDYIYYLGNYYYGSKTDSQNLMTGNGNDEYYDQCSPILGSTSSFEQAKAVRLNLSFYTFRGWFELTNSVDPVNGNIMLSEYNIVKEATYISRNITLYGYYYSINKPTSLKFYTWDDNVDSYVEYSGYSDDYTLTSNTTTAPFGLTDNEITANTTYDISELVDENGWAMLRYNKQYGVDGTGFNKVYSTDEIPELSTFLQNLVRTYWYYQESYDVLAFNDSGTIRYLKYGFDGGSHGLYYIDGSSNYVKVKVFTSNMVNFVMKKASSDWSSVIDSTEYVVNLETHFKYDFRGSNLYVRVYKSGSEKFYPIKELSKEQLISFYYGGASYSGSASTDNIPDSLQHVFEDGSWLPEFRYYVEIKGVNYYISKIYGGSFTQSIYTSSGAPVSDASMSITTLDNYYLSYNGEFTKINFEPHYDINDAINEGSLYYSPNEYANTVVFEGTTYYFEYATRDLYRFYYEDTNTYETYAELPAKVYKAVNDNYQVQVKAESATGSGAAYWKIGDVTVRALPSPNTSFWYGDKLYGHIGYINFTETDLENMKSSGETVGGTGAGTEDSGGLIYQEILSYINYNFSGRGQVFINNLKEAVGIRIMEYDFEDDFLQNLLVVNSYVYDPLDNKTIKEVYVNVPIEFVLDVVNEYGDTESVPISVTVVKNFKMITTSTVVDTNIDAIPIYSQFIMQFNKGSATATTSTNEWSVEINTSKVQAAHFDTINGSTHSYNRNNGDFVKFVVLDKAGFNYIKTNTNGISKDINNYMSTLLKQAGGYVSMFTQPDIDDASQKIDIDLTSESAGEYFVFAFYYQSGSSSHIIRVSDNFVHLNLTGSGSSRVTEASIKTFKTYVDPDAAI